MKAKKIFYITLELCYNIKYPALLYFEGRRLENADCIPSNFRNRLTCNSCVHVHVLCRGTDAEEEGDEESEVRVLPETEKQ